MLRDKLNDAMKEAMRARDQAALGTIRLILAKLKDVDIAARTEASREGVAEDKIELKKPEQMTGSGDPAQARSLLPLINWCLAYNRRQLTTDGVIASDSDELENRFPAGKVNLSTNMLAFGALQSSATIELASS